MIPAGITLARVCTATAPRVRRDRLADRSVPKDGQPGWGGTGSTGGCCPERGVTPACRPRGVLRGVPVLGLHRLGLLLFQELLPDHLGTERPRVLDPGPDEERDHAETRPGEHDPDGRPAGALEDVDPAGQPLARTGLAGRPEAKSSPRLTQPASASSAAYPAGSMQMKPDKTRPPRTIGRACGSRSACSRPSAPTLIISAVPVT